MINPKNKRVQVTLPGETAELLESLSKRYSKSNSEIVKWAINVLASKKRHNFIIKLSEDTEEQQDEKMTDEEAKALIDKYIKQDEERERKEREEQEKDDWLPF